jgi:hypothetical protein
LKDLEARLAALRSRDKPKSKFTFNKKSTTTSTSVPQPSAHLKPQEVDLSDTRRLSGGDSSAFNTHTLSSLHDQRITPDLLGGLEGEYTLSLTDISDCIIDLRAVSTSGSHDNRLKSLHARDLRRCALVTDQLEASALLHDFEDCLLILGVHQVRHCP